MPTDDNFLQFMARLLWRAGSETANFFELKMRTLLILVMCIGLGFLMHYKVKGPVAAKEELSTRMILDFAPTAILVTVLFVVNLIRAPYLLYSEFKTATAGQMLNLQAKITQLETQPAPVQGEQPRIEVTAHIDPAEVARLLAAIGPRQNTKSEIQDPALLALIKEAVNLSSEVYQFAIVREDVLRTLPPIDPNGPRNKQPTNPWWMREAFKEDTRRLFRSRGYWGRCYRLQSSLKPRGIDMPWANTLCDKPYEPVELREISSRLVELANEVMTKQRPES